MNSGLIAASIAFIITSGGILLGLLTAQGVADLSDVSQAGYLVALITGVIAGAKAYQDRMARPPKQPRKNKQSGFTTGGFIPHLAIICILAIFWLPGCSAIDKVKDAEPWKPFQDCVSATVATNNSIAACIESVTMLAKLSDAAEESGLITETQKLIIITKLYDVAVMLRVIREYKDVIVDATALLKVQTELINLKEEIPILE